MMPNQICFYSPFSANDVKEKNNQILLLLFILKELVRLPQAQSEESIVMPSFGWTLRSSSSEKLQEHFSLLPYAFPKLTQFVAPLYQALQNSPGQLASLLEPFIMACQHNENLLLFLVQHQNELAVKPLLDKICPDGIDALKEKIASSFRKRGYPFTRWTHSSKTL